MRKTNYFIFILIILFIFSACSVPGFKRNNNIFDKNNKISNEIYPLNITDLNENKIIINKKPEIIVSFSPAVTEILYELGYGEKVVGITQETKYLDKTKDKVIVGYYSNIDIDKVKSLKPDVIFASQYTFKNIADNFKQVNIPVVYAESQSYNGTFECINLLAKIFNESEKGRNLCNKIQSEVDKLNEIIPKTKPNILYIQCADPLFVAGSKTLVNDIIYLSGGVNAAQDVNGYNSLDYSSLLNRKIDYIILSNNLTNELHQDYFKNHFYYKDLEVVKNNKIFKISDDDLFTTASPRIINAINEMIKIIS